MSNSTTVGEVLSENINLKISTKLQFWNQNQRKHGMDNVPGGLCVTNWMKITLKLKSNIALLCYSLMTSWSWLGLWRHCWQRLGRVHFTDWEWELCTECPIRFPSYFVLCCQLFHIQCHKRTTKWLPEHCGVQRHLRFCLGYAPAAPAGIRQRHTPACLWSPQCTGNYSKSF